MARKKYRPGMNCEKLVNMLAMMQMATKCTVISTLKRTDVFLLLRKKDATTKSSSILTDCSHVCA